MSPASYQSKSGPGMLLSNAMYPSSDIVADDRTFPMVSLPLSLGLFLRSDRGVEANSSA
jgi:hypothetical protein